MFKVSNNDRTELIRQLQQSIRRLDLIDTYDMIETIRIETKIPEDGKLTLVIVGMEYYRYLDSMSDTFRSSRGTRQTPGYPITENWLANSEVQKRFASITDDYIAYLSKKYPILNVLAYMSNFKIQIDFEDIDFF